jgi:RNA-directed DNA polymerase
MPLPPPTEPELTQFKTLKSVTDVAAFLGTTERRLNFHLYSSKRPRYRTFKIAKASGGTRLIASPPALISLFQRQLLRCITAMVRPKLPCHGFSLGRSVATNAKQHVGRVMVLNIDLLDFFPSFHFGRVQGVFQNHPFNFAPNVAAVLANICCFDGRLPQGGPISPMMSNLICRGLDRDLERLARNNRCRYTRYADDITLSTSLSEFSPNIIAFMPTLKDSTPILGSELLQVITKHDVRLNESKTRLRTASQRQEVTGLIVNQKVNVKRTFVRNVRGIVHDCETRGLEAAESRFKESLDVKQRLGDSPPLINHLQGKLEYLRMIRGEDDDIYARLVLRTQAFSGTFKKGVSIWGRLAKPGFVEHALWIVLGKDDGGRIVTSGTAFSLRGIGTVSASHVFKDKSATGFKVRSWYLISAIDPGKEYRIESIRDSNRLDLAIVELPVLPIRGVLIPDRGALSTGDPISVVGFPQWNTSADKLFMAGASISQLKIVSLGEYILTTALIREGNSGGPIFNSAGMVVGVALYDSTSSIAPNGGISIRHIDEVSLSTARSL